MKITRITKTVNICKYRRGPQQELQKLREFTRKGPNENYENYNNLPERHKNS